MVERGELSEGHARAVLAVPDQEDRRRLAREIVRRGLSVRAAERAARWAGARQKPRRAAARRSIRRSPTRARVGRRRLTGRPVRVTARRLEIAVRRRVRARGARRGPRARRAAVTTSGAAPFVGPCMLGLVASRTSNRSRRSRRTTPLARCSCAWRRSRRRAGSSPSSTELRGDPELDERHEGHASRELAQATRRSCSRSRTTCARPPSSTRRRLRPAGGAHRAGKPPGFRSTRSHGGTSLLAPHPKRWAIVDSNHGPPPYQSGALTN